MTIIKFEVQNQITGIPEETLTIEDAVVLRDKLKTEYLESLNSLFAITLLKQDMVDGPIAQLVVDDTGKPIESANIVEDFALISKTTIEALP